MASGATAVEIFEESVSKVDNVVELFDIFYEWRLEDSPELATMVGDHRYDDKLESCTPDAFRERKWRVETLLKRAEALSATQGSTDLEIFIETLQLYLDGYETRSFVFPMCRIEGVHVDLAQTISYMKFEDEGDFLRLDKRLRATSHQFLGMTLIMRLGMKEKLTLHAVSMQDVGKALREIAAAEPADSVFFRPVKDYKGDLSEEIKEKLLDAVQQAQKSFHSLAIFIEDEYVPKCRPDIDIVSVGGEAYYQQCLNFHLGCKMTAQQVHETGLREVERINGEILKVIKELGLDVTPKEFGDKLREDPNFLLGSEDEIKKRYETILQDRIQPQLLKFFRKLPEAKLNLVLMDKSRAAGPAAYYIQGSMDGKRPGTFYINGNDPHRTPSYILPALALHEANPGHHLQGSRLLETPNLPKFRLLMEDRKYSEMPTHFPMHTAYTEGWGLYCEFLGHEMGVYKDPYERYGHYSQEMLRACRLVVDTGMHALKWSRERAIAYLEEHTGSSHSEIVSEIDRYITWPGQACGYKIGEIELKRLRSKAAEALGNKFDIRDFHEVVMDNVGTMAFLERAVDRYIKTTSASS